jgi:hypothetical protein
MGNNHNRTLIGVKIFFQPLEGVEIQMIGWFIKEKE